MLAKVVLVLHSHDFAVLTFMVYSPSDLLRQGWQYAPFTPSLLNTVYLQNKPNGQFHLSHDRDTIMNFMHDLSIRKVPGIGRVNEQILESIGIKVCLHLPPFISV